ncbi:MAG: gamma-glutamyltransferase family protein [Sphaerochaetaceae bacterium]
MFTTSWENRYSLPRLPVVTKRAMVATSQPTAAQAGISIIERGGNAIDAAIAVAAALTVVEPTCNGIGGDAFAIVWFEGKMFALNGSGPAPSSISIEALKQRGFSKMPQRGWETVTVPGIPASWAALSKRFGKLPLTETLKPAIKLANEGYAVSYNLAALWEKSYTEYKEKLNKEEFSNWFTTFAPNGRALQCGEIYSSIDHGRTLDLIAKTDAQAFYKGELAERIDHFSKQYNAFITKEDLANYNVEWIEPLKADYRGFDVWEIPPNGQGISVLMALNILNEIPYIKQQDETFTHYMIEAIKLAMGEASHSITEAKLMKTTTEQLLSCGWSQKARNRIGQNALNPSLEEIPKGGTVYLATADEAGNMVSYIQSNYEEFGSALVVPKTGIALQNRGSNFSLDPNHINALAPGKKTYHTIIPGFITKDGLPVGPFGVMGGFNQPQGHLQILSNLIDKKLNPQATLDAPRWRWLQNKEILVETHFPLHIKKELLKRGHKVETSMDLGLFGRGQIILRKSENGSLIGGCESRTDSLIAVL